MEGVTGDDGASCGLGGPNGGYSQMDEASLAAKRAKMDGSDSDRLLNFATAADEFELNLRRQKIPRDPMSHRIIEKRRRDRMNNCLADLSRLIPASYHKQGQGRIEKTEIIEMAIKHINMLQQRVEELEKKVSNQEDGKAQAALIATTQTTTDCAGSKFYMGFKEAQDEVMRFLVEVESINTMDPFCKKIMKHLENAGQKFVVIEQKTELSPIDGDNNSQPAMFSHHHHSAFYSTALGGVGSGGSGRNGAGVGQDSNGVGGAGNVSGSGPGSVTPLPEDRTPSVGVGSGVGGVGGVGGDAKSQDDHLRYLLGDQSVNAMTAGGMTVNGQEANDDRTGTLPMFSYSSHLSGMGSGVGSSGYFSDASNMDKNSPSGSTSSRENVYKFKHNITKRFSQEGRHHHHHHHHRYHHTPHHQHTSDTSSNTSSRDLEDDQGQLRWKGGSGKHKSSGSGGGSSSMFTDDMGTENNSPNSDEGNSGNSTSGNSSSTTTKRTHHHHHHHRPGKNGQNNNGGGRTSPDCHNSTLASGQPNSTSSVALPGFILHPTGTHYMPISVHNSNISDLFESNDQESMPVFHPISIPVHFRRPVISMPNITICTHLTSKQKDRSIKN